MLISAFRNLWTQVITGFFVSFFIFYQPQIVTEANRFTIFVSLLIVIPLHSLVLDQLDKIVKRRFYRFKVFWTTFLTITQTQAVWSLISIASRFLTEALQSVFTFDALHRLILVTVMISGFIAMASELPKEDEKK